MEIPYKLRIKLAIKYTLISMIYHLITGLIEAIIEDYGAGRGILSLIHFLNLIMSVIIFIVAFNRSFPIQYNNLTIKKVKKISKANFLWNYFISGWVVIFRLLFILLIIGVIAVLVTYISKALGYTDNVSSTIFAFLEKVTTTAIDSDPYIVIIKSLIIILGSMVIMIMGNAIAIRYIIKDNSDCFEVITESLERDTTKI